ncbi:hypothetical protein JTE90_019316 [Oedothorax gibbosus]|uniref:BTB domain-containing protein n=1 Tax=Oedothorax gibbosus TaxID=931172 RepID=A0AAV6TXB2_9ARAC|nr:hypothetical protein JTE90_019316 [Oedothorax gibbosus]
MNVVLKTDLKQNTGHKEYLKIEGYNHSLEKTESENLQKASMSISNEEKCFTFTWHIKNFEVLASWLRENDSIDSPTLNMNNILQKNCKLCLKLSWFDKQFEFKLHGLQKYKIPDRCMIFFSSSDGEVFLNELQNANAKDKMFVIQENTVFGDNKKSILPDGILTVCCKIYDKALKTEEFRIHSTIHKLNYLWIIKKFDPSKFYTNTFIEKDNFLFYMSLDPEDHGSSRKIITGGVPIKDGTLSFLDGKWSIKSQDGKEYYNNNIYNPLQTAWKRKIEIVASYVGKDLQLELESLYSAYTTSGTVPKFSNTLSNDIRNLYQEQLHTDATLNTADGKSFEAHKNILAARSPVFRAMFEKDEMSERRSGVVDIDDVDSETVDRMLAFLYSDSLDDLQWEEAAALYYAADKYAVQPLKKKNNASIDRF